MRLNKLWHNGNHGIGKHDVLFRGKRSGRTIYVLGFFKISTQCQKIFPSIAQ